MQEKIIQIEINDLINAIAHYKSENKRLIELYKSEHEKVVAMNKQLKKARCFVDKLKEKAGYYDKGQR